MDIRPEEADIVILNTCSVRKALNRALGLLGNLKHRKKRVI